MSDDVEPARTRMLPISEAARALGVSIDTLRRWERDGKIEHQPR